MSNKVIFYGIAAGIILFFLSKKSAAKNLRIYFSSISLKKQGGLNLPTIVANFRIINPTSGSLVIDSIAGDLKVNDSLLSSINQNQPLTIPGNSESIYSINIKTPIISLASTIIYLLKSKTKKIKVQFDGTVNSGGILLPINETVFQL